MARLIRDLKNLKTMTALVLVGVAFLVFKAFL